MSKLSKVQQKRLGGILTVSRDRLPLEPIAQELLDSGFISHAEGKLQLTAKGESERERLLTLAGLNFERKSPQGW